MNVKQQDDVIVEIPKLILGSNSFGTLIDKSTVKKIINKLFDQQNGLSIIEIDSSMIYGLGKSEQSLSMFKNNKNIMISTKVTSFGTHNLSKENIHKQCYESLNRLERNCIDILYIHHPSTAIPILHTLFAINELYKQGKFKRFGICHYSSWEVCQIIYLCDKYNLCKPSVYQGRYNAFRRENESELLPCLKHFGLAFYAFSPTARGILAGRHNYKDRHNNCVQIGKFTSTSKNIHFYDYWRKLFFDGRDMIYNALGSKDKHLLLQTIFSWLMYHSKLDGKKGDGIIIGGSKYEHFEHNLYAVKNAKPLNKNIINVFDRVWNLARMEGLKYHRKHQDVMRIINKL
eukprot:282518_1